MRHPPLVQPPGSPLLAALDRRIELVFTELAGNALRHGRPPVHVHLASTATAWLISVMDSAPDREPLMGSLSSDQVGGRGLAMAMAMASSTGWYADMRTKTVWAEVADAPPAALLRQLGNRGHRAPRAEDGAFIW